MLLVQGSMELDRAAYRRRSLVVPPGAARRNTVRIAAFGNAERTHGSFRPYRPPSAGYWMELSEHDSITWATDPQFIPSTIPRGSPAR
jgi:hypothetical protein